MLNKKLIKNDIIKTLCDKTGYSRAYSKKLIDDLIDIIINNIKFGKVTIKNLGSFKIINKKERIGRNPKTKEEFNISSRNVITFKASKILLKHINNQINEK